MCGPGPTRLRWGTGCSLPWCPPCPSCHKPRRRPGYARPASCPTSCPSAVGRVTPLATQFSACRTPPPVSKLPPPPPPSPPPLPTHPRTRTCTRTPADRRASVPECPAPFHHAVAVQATSYSAGSRPLAPSPPKLSKSSGLNVLAIIIGTAVGVLVLVAVVAVVLCCRRRTQPRSGPKGVQSVRKAGTVMGCGGVLAGQGTFRSSGGKNCASRELRPYKPSW